MNKNEKYQKGKIYKIVDNGYNMTYYGSTIEKYLCNRMSKHKRKYKLYREKNEYTSFIIFEKYGIENCKIELVENYPCNSKEELLKREGYYIKNNECVNKNISGRTQKEYYEDNKEKIKENTKIWRENNKEYYKQKKKEYREKNKEKIKESRKKHYEDNKEKILEQNRLYKEAKKK